MFKEKYIRDNEMIKPSDEFLEKLKNEMKKVESSKGSKDNNNYSNHSNYNNHNNKNNNNRNSAGRKAFMAAAAIALIVIGAASYNRISNTQKNTIMQQTEISQNTGSAEKDESIKESADSKNSENSGSIEGSKNTGNSVENSSLFSNSSWYDSGMSSEEIYKTLVKRILSQDDLKEINVSSTNDFTNGKTMDATSVKGLADSLKSGTLINQDTINKDKIKDDSSSKENPKYYMASFNNGDIIKFVIYDGRYFECSEFEGKFLIS